METSIFDLSPSEKLQLVEDLWDDLASTPESVRSMNGRSKNWPVEKPSLMKNPGSGLSWEQVKQRVRRPNGR